MRTLLTLSLIGSLAATTPAAITFLEVAQWSYFTQTGNSAPTSADSHSFSARIFGNVNGEIGTSTVTIPDSTTRNLTSSAFVAQYFDAGFPTMADVSNEYGAGTYSLAISTGVHAGKSDTVNYEGPVTFSENPYFQDFLADAQAHVSQARTFEWSTTYGVTGEYTGRQNYFFLTNLTTNTTLVNTQGAGSSFGSYTLGANALTAGHNYRATLVYGALDQTASTAFAGAFRTGSTYSVVNAEFTAVPEPGTMAALGLGLAALRRRRAK